MVRIFTDRRMLEHRPASRHPERPERLQMVIRQLERTGLLESCPSGLVRPATDLELSRVHDPDYIAAIAEYEANGGGNVEADTWISAGSNLAARLAAGAVVEAVGSVINTPVKRAFCAVRPPGHHARPAEPMGFCLFGSVAVAAADAIENHGLRRVLIVDWDVHHGNGTQEMVYEDGRIGFVSVHRYPFYPGTGAMDETGSGDGLGMIKNVPLAFGISRRDYLASFRQALHDLADKTKPELIILSAGFDAHAEDPVGNLGLEVEDFVTMTQDVLEVAEVHAQGRLVSVMEGGYNVPILAGCVEAHVLAMGAKPA